MASAPPPPEIQNVAELPLVIETERLRLRPLVETDVDDLWPHVSDPEVAKLMAWAAHRDKTETLEWVRGRIEAIASGTELAWAIEHEGRASGIVALIGLTWRFRAWRVDRAELGYWIGKPLWNRGLVSEAARAVTTWGFETLGLHKITVGCVEGNQASQRIIEKLGFRYLCCKVEDAWRDGRWLNHLRWEMLASEWRAADDTTMTSKFSRPRPP